MSRLTLTIAAAWSAAATIVGLVVLILAAELSAPTKRWLASVFSHHWIGKGVLAVLFFVVMTVVIASLLPKKPRAALQNGVWTLTAAATISTLVLTLFFWWHAGV